MRFECDEAKRRANIRKHGLDFADAPEMFRGPFLARPDYREDYGEERWIGSGITKNRVAFVTESDETIRIISLRNATNEERQEFETTLPDGLEEN